ncbi:MAG: diguanylate cyclase [Acidobacteria bacterium]|nr:diguanylate cyclase [Acidobacteriota bacterium]
MGLTALLLATLVGSRVGLVSFQRLAIPDDVPAHLCSAIAQDRSGMLWFGTQGGLVRFDGNELRVFRSNPTDPKTIGGNYVRALLVARDGRLWVGTFSGGLSVFDPRTETFTRFDRSTELAYDRVEGLAEDHDGMIWVATSAGLDRLDPRTRRVEHFRHDARDANSIADDRVRGLLVTRDGTLWVGSRDGLQRYRKSEGFVRVAPQIGGQFATRLFEDRRGRIWIGTEEQGASVFDPRSGAVKRLAPRPQDPNGLSHYWVYGIAEAEGGEVWIATFGGGVDVVDENTLAVVDRLRHDAALPNSIGADRVGAVFRDRAGAMWVGTWGEGIARHDPRTRAFRELRASSNQPEGLTHPAVVRALEMQDGTVWAGTNGNGIDIFDRDWKRVGAVRTPELADGAITCLAQAPDGAIWVATLNSMLHVRRPGAKTFERVQQLPGGPIRTIAFDTNGNAWVGAAEGMARIDGKTLASRVYRSWPGAAKSSPAIEAIVVARDGKLWVGSDNGLYAFDPQTESATRIAKDAARSDGLPDNWVPDLMLAHDGRLWLGTAGGACVLTGWNGREAHFERIADRLGRTPASAEALIEDDEGKVWIGPRLRIDPRHWTARELGRADGESFRNFFIASRSRMRDGRLLFGSPEGLLVVDPKALRTAEDDAPIVATSLQVGGKARPGASVLSALSLTAKDRSFTLDFAALDFAAPQRRTYRYRLDGLDPGWTIAGPSQRSLTYNRLPPGQYTLRVGVSNADGQWSARELRLPVTVMPAVHQTWWFRALVVLWAGALAYGIYRLRIRQMQARARELEQLVAERTRELASAYEKIEEASLTDPLTGLRNRRFLEQTIGADLELAMRGHGDLVILLADLDHFKSVNDTYGHGAGDAVLAELADRMRQTFRASDYVVRWGGEEFLIVIRFVDRREAPELAEKLRAAVAAQPFVLPDGTLLPRTCSIGYAAWPGAPTWERAIDLADAALYTAKKGGRNACVGAESKVA